MDVARTHGLAVGFHRAFDFAPAPESAARVLAELGVDRTLAAGIPGFALGATPLDDRVERVGRAARAVPDDVFAVVPCGGVRSTNASAFGRVTAHVHASCRRRSAAGDVEFDAEEAAALRQLVERRRAER